MKTKRNMDLLLKYTKVIQILSLHKFARFQKVLK